MLYFYFFLFLVFISSVNGNLDEYDGVYEEFDDNYPEEIELELELSFRIIGDTLISTLNLEIDLSDDDTLEDYVRVVSLLLTPHWFDTTSIDQIRVDPIKGGLTNNVLQATNLNCDDDTEKIESIDCISSSAIVHVYPDIDIIDREHEIKIAVSLNEKNLGPKVYGTFFNGRVEEFMKGRNIQFEDLEKQFIRTKIAERMAMLHNISFDPIAIPSLTTNISLWDTIDTFFDLISQYEFEDDNFKSNIINLNLSKIKKDYDIMRSHVPKYNFLTVFCHNDLHFRNILYDVESEYLFFIDFDYSGYNPAPYDIANHFLEYCGLDCDWSKFPSSEIQREFIITYLVSLYNNSNNNLIDSYIPDSNQVDIYLQAVQEYIPFSHLYWGLWGLLHSSYTQIEDFDFFQYATKRLIAFREYTP